MFELLIIISRYFFVFYIAYFLFQGLKYILIERKIIEGSKNKTVSKQKIVIVFMHINAFLILSYVPYTFSFDMEILILGFLWLFFFILMSFLTSKIYKKSCPLIWNGVFFLMSVGIIMLQRLSPHLASQQIIWFFFSFSIILLIPFSISVIPKFEKLEYVYLILGFLFLLSPFMFGEEIFGARNWVRIGNITFQPSEIVKFLFIFYLASVLRKKLTIKELIFPTFMSFLYVLILASQRNLGAGLIFFVTFLIMIYVSTGRESLLFLGVFLASVASFIGYTLFAHVRVRVAIWLNPWQDVHGIGNQIVHSLFAIGTFGLFGSGLTRGMPNLIPVVSRDMIFAAISEEFGSLFGIGIIFVYIMIFYRGVNIALRCKRRYYSLIAIGITSMLAFQTFLILGGTIKLIPLTGVTLPFISYGGTSVLVSTMKIGILQWIFMYYEK